MIERSTKRAGSVKHVVKLNGKEIRVGRDFDPARFAKSLSGKKPNTQEGRKARLARATANLAKR